MADLRRRFLLGLIRLSRIDVESMVPFMDEVPMSAAESPDDPWWESADCELLYEALLEAIELLGPDG